MIRGVYPINTFCADQMGAALNARAISHLEEISDSGIEAMSRSGSVAVVLPTTAFILRLNPPPVRRMIDSGVVVALGSDFNPNAHCYAMVSQKLVCDKPNNATLQSISYQCIACLSFSARSYAFSVHYVQNVHERSIGCCYNQRSRFARSCAPARIDRSGKDGRPSSSGRR